MKLDSELIQPKATNKAAASKNKTIRALLVLGMVMWLLFVSIGLSRVWSYENAPGVSATPPQRWPSQSQIQPSYDQATLVMLAHPHCPCTRASIGELASIMAHSQGRLTAYVLFLKPVGFSEDWEQTDLWRSAAAIPGVKVIRDDDGSEAQLFRAETSGQTVLYDREGRLLFSGGITGSRGHSGDNPGRSSIVALANTGSTDRAETSVFGCPLFDPNSKCREHENAK